LIDIIMAIFTLLIMAYGHYRYGFKVFTALDFHWVFGKKLWL